MPGAGNLDRESRPLVRADLVRFLQVFGHGNGSLELLGVLPFLYHADQVRVPFVRAEFFETISNLSSRYLS